MSLRAPGVLAEGCGSLALDYSPPQVDRNWGIWGSYYKIAKVIFYLLKGDYILLRC